MCANAKKEEKTCKQYVQTIQCVESSPLYRTLEYQLKTDLVALKTVTNLLNEQIDHVTQS